MILVRNLDHFPSFSLKCDSLYFHPIFFIHFARTIIVMIIIMMIIINFKI